MYLVNAMPPQIDPALLARLALLDTGTLGHVLDRGFMDPGVRQILPGSMIVGTAVTVRSTLPDSAMGHYALKWIRPGDILVIDRGQDQRNACWGGTTSQAAARIGLTGLVMDGVGNDLDLANASSLPIWCRGATPVTTKYRGLGGEMNVAVSCGGVAVSPGDAIAADANGVVVIRPDQVLQAIELAEASKAHEEGFVERLLRGEVDSYPLASGAVAMVEGNLDPRSTMPIDR